MVRPAAYPEAFKKAVVNSLIIHIALLMLAFIGLPAVFLPQEQIPMDVVMVDITRGNSEELGDSPPEVKHLPENTIQEQKNPMPEAKDVKTTAPQKVDVAKAPAKVDPNSMKDPEKMVKKPQPRGVDSKMAAALAKINDSLNQRKITTQIAQSKGTEGYKYGTTDKPTNMLNNPVLISYRAKVRQRVTREYINTGARPEKQPQVLIYVNSAGQIVSKSIFRRSGNASADAAALRAVDRSSPVPVPPEAIRDYVKQKGFIIEF